MLLPIKEHKGLAWICQAGKGCVYTGNNPVDWEILVPDETYEVVYARLAWGA